MSGNEPFESVPMAGDHPDQAPSRRLHCVVMHSPGNDLWLADFTPTELGLHLFSIEA
ncbi:hypothetical protein ACVWY1_000102 [Pseudomonas sp. TE6288]|nr:hypothetical protein [Pseudomonas hunanensis]